MGDRMPKRVDQYRLNAVKCFELSQTFKDPDAKRTLFAMANAWRTLAAQRVKNIEMPALDPSVLTGCRNRLYASILSGAVPEDVAGVQYLD